MDRKITYRWWNQNRSPIKPEHEQELGDEAIKRIAEMIPQGFTSGQLVASIHTSSDDPDEGLDYEGWWGISELIA